jgi:hypothetical protein
MSLYYCLPGVVALAGAIKDMRALSSLNLAKNSLGGLVLPADWKKTEYKKEWVHSDGSKVTDKPGKPEGIIAIATAIPDMGALTKLDISNNDIGQGGSLQLIIEVCDTKIIELDKHESESDDDY